jgi:hypothetical protein
MLHSFRSWRETGRVPDIRENDAYEPDVADLTIKARQVSASMSAGAPRCRLQLDRSGSDFSIA